MRSHRSRSLLTLGAALAVALACAPADDSQTDPADSTPAQAADAPSAEAPAQMLTCWLRRGTMEEAAARPSPLGETAFTVGGQEARLCYGRPSARGRTIFGELEAYGVPWRSGANEATALHLTFAADVGGVALEPGSYSLYTVPGEENWEVVLNSNAQRWGIPITPEVRANDVGSFTVPAEVTEGLVETLTYRWEPTSDSAGHLILEWENTRIRIPVAQAGM
jgi:hypothetical protein